jgi:hypothetical protein
MHRMFVAERAIRIFPCVNSQRPLRRLHSPVIRRYRRDSIDTLTKVNRLRTGTWKEPAAVEIRSVMLRPQKRRDFDSQIALWREPFRVDGNRSVLRADRPDHPV